MKRILVLLLFTLPAFAQGSFYQLTQPFPNGTLTVCPVGTANPCPSPSSIFSDAALSAPVVQPVQLGPGGNYGFWVASGQYIVRIGQPYNASFNITLGGAGGGAGTVSANNTAAGAVANYAAAGGSTTVGPTTLNYVAPTLTVSTTAGGNGVLALSGNTSGVATITAPATAGTASNPVTFSNVITAPVGVSTANVSYGFSGSLTSGLLTTSAGTFTAAAAGTNVFLVAATPQLRLGSAGGFVFSSNADPTLAAFDTSVSRSAAGVVSHDTTAIGNGAGVSRAAAFRSSGAAATLTGTGACATFGAQTGGSSVGQSSCASATAASTLTITPGTTAPTGWVCYVQDQTTRANLFQQTSNSTTACTLTVTSVTQNDVFVFSAMQF